jgi:ABC-type uncharacterized transport system substrate-binding protein
VTGKRLELLREVVPTLRGLAILANVGAPNAVLEIDEVKAAAGKLGLDVAAPEIRRAEELPLLLRDSKVTPTRSMSPSTRC